MIDGKPCLAVTVAILAQFDPVFRQCADGHDYWNLYTACLRWHFSAQLQTAFNGSQNWTKNVQNRTQSVHIRLEVDLRLLVLSIS